MIPPRSASPRILLVLDTFKGSLPSAQVAQAIAQGLTLEAIPPDSLTILPIGDGGEGTLDALASHAEPIEIPVRGPDGGAALGRLLLRGRWAWIEAASACGLGLASSSALTGRTSFGVGQLILAAVERGAREIVVGCGGTATLDLGLGLLSALGAELTWGPPAPPLDPAPPPHDPQLAPAQSPLPRSPLAELTALDLRPAIAALAGANLVAAVDVDNILTGPRGALEFAPQKGAPEASLPALLADIDRAALLLDQAALAASSPAQPRAPRCSEVPGAGAAGGIAAAILALGGRATPAFDEVASRLGLDEALERADLVVTGEGRLDATTWRGKIVHRVLSASRGRARVWIVAGQATGSAVDRALAEDAEIILTLVSDSGEVGESIASPGARLVRAGRQMGRALRGWAPREG